MFQVVRNNIVFTVAEVDVTLEGIVIAGKPRDKLKY